MSRTPQFRKFVTGLLLLTASTGAIDAVSYIALDRVFTGNMTGNVLFLGFALVGVADIPFLNNAVALVGFVAGSMLAGRLVGRRGGGGGLPRVSLVVLGIGAALILATGVVWYALDELPQPVLLSVTFLLAAVMGAQVGAVKPIGNAEITTVVVTNTLANLARESRLGSAKQQAWLQRLLAIVCMGVGAMVGAAIVVWWGGPAALVASTVIFTAGLGFLVAGARRASIV